MNSSQMRTIHADEIEALEKLVRVQLATSLPGVKPVALIGTVDEEGNRNLAPFSSLVHLGSNPALIGMVSRPDSVERHTLANIRETGSWTINHLHPELVEAAHHCGARYPRDVSEFGASGLSPEQVGEFPAPFVAESRFRMGLDLEEVVDIRSNGTCLIVGRVRLVQLPDVALAADGSVDLAHMDLVASTALDTYFTIRPQSRQPYPKPRTDRPEDST